MTVAAKKKPPADDIPKGASNRANLVAKLTIGSLDNTKLTVSAHYNPKELQIDKDVPWTFHNDLPKEDESKKTDQKGEKKHDAAEISAMPTRSMSIELLFDRFEEDSSIQPELDVLEELTSIKKFGSSVEHQRRPHHCIITWGKKGLLPFRCVIQSLSTKVSMFAADGRPLRATCTVKVKEVVSLSK